MCGCFSRSKKGIFDTINTLLLFKNVAFDIECFPFQISTVSELGSPTDPNNANIAKVKFTVRTSGVYNISVMIGELEFCV